MTPHSVCIKCRGFCTVASRCEECADWDDVVEGGRYYESKFAWCCSHCARSKRQGDASASSNFNGGQEGPGEVVTEPGHEYSLSLVVSIASQDSASQAGHVLPLEGQLTSLLMHGSQLQSMLSEIISSQVAACLSNLASLPASLLSQVECLASTRPSSPKSTALSRVQKALLAEKVWGGSLGHERMRVRLGKRTTPVDAPLYPKQSPAEMRAGSTRPPWLRTQMWLWQGCLTHLPILDSWVRVRQPVTTRSVKRLQSLCPQELGCTMLCRTTPLLRPRHHRNWTLW